MELKQRRFLRRKRAIHHQTFRLSFEPFREPIERFESALRDLPKRIALCEIGETFVLPL